MEKEENRMETKDPDNRDKPLNCKQRILLILSYMRVLTCIQFSKILRRVSTNTFSKESHSRSELYTIFVSITNYQCSTVSMNWEPRIEASNHWFSSIIENASTDTKGMEASTRMSDEVLHVCHCIHTILILTYPKAC